MTTTTRLFTPAQSALTDAIERMIHTAPNHYRLDIAAPSRVFAEIRRQATGRVYGWIGQQIGVPAARCLPCMLSDEQCRRALDALAGTDYPAIRVWAKREATP